MESDHLNSMRKELKDRKPERATERERERGGGGGGGGRDRDKVSGRAEGEQEEGEREGPPGMTSPTSCRVREVMEPCSSTRTTP